MRTDLLQQRTPWHLQAEEALRHEPLGEQPHRFEQIGSWRSDGQRDQKSMMREYMFAESIVAFLVERHGRGQIPRLLNGLTRHNNWPALMDDLYGIPVETLEAEWNDYLIERFEWSVIR